MTVQFPDLVVALATVAKSVFASYVPTALIFGKDRSVGDLRDVPIRVELPQTERPAKILVIDDDPVILKAAELALADKRYEVATVTDASAAAAIVRAHKPDLIVLDLLFPPDNTEGGMAWDGFHILEWLRHMGKAGDTPVIVLTSLEPAECKDRCRAAGVDGLLHKPLNKAELSSAIEKSLDQAAREKKANPPVDFEV